MTRTLPALAAALFAAAAFFSSSAEACISCEYVPPVVNTPVQSWSGHHSHSYSAPRQRRARTAKRRSRQIERAVVKAKQKAPAIETAKSVEPPLPVKAPEQAELKVTNENSTISTASIDKSEDKTVSKSEPATEANAVGCKKFFASVGMTLSVPCE